MIVVNLSIIVNCFNKEEFLEEAIASVKRQTKRPKEIILIHDKCNSPVSHEGTTTIILPQNVGVSKARDIGFKYSTGQLVLFLDGDDIVSPDYLEKMILVIAAGADVAYPDLFIWNGDSSSLTITPSVFTSKSVLSLGKIPVPVTSMMKRNVYEELGGFRELPVLEDLDFWVRALGHGFVMKKAQTLLWYRRYGGTRNTVDIIKRKEVLAEIMSQIK